MFDTMMDSGRLKPVVTGADVREDRCDCQGIGLIGDQPCPFHFEYETEQAKLRRQAREAEEADIGPLPF
jgi:hypothetical protein